jgi:hypothetical protein
MNDCIDRPDTRLHPTHAPEALFATCNAGAIHTGRSASDPPLPYKPGSTLPESGHSSGVRQLRFGVESGPAVSLIDGGRNAGVISPDDPSRQHRRELSPALTIGWLRLISTDDHTKPPHSGGAFISRQVSGGGTSTPTRDPMSSQQSAFIPALNNPELKRDAPCLFEVEHGDTVIRIADDWDGHVLIEKLYVALRKARQARDRATPIREAAPVREDELVELPMT